MRKLFFSAFVLLLSASALMAQDGADALKAAKKAFDKYTLSQDTEAIVEAATLADKAFMSSEVKEDPKSLNTTAAIFAGYYNYFLGNRPEGNEMPVIDNAMGKAADAYMMAFNKSEKKGAQKAAVKGLTLVQSNLSNQGKVAYQLQDYKKAHMAFVKGIEVDKFLTDNGGVSLLAGPLLLDENYFAGLTALLSEDYAGAKPYYTTLYNSPDYNDASVFDGLAKISMNEKDMTAAAKYLDEGRKAFPEDKGLLFSQINLFLQQGELETLMTSLDEGIAADPSNPSLYLVKAQTYETLYNQSAEAGTPDESKFDQAISTLESGLENAKGDSKLTYALGLLQFNRGATMSQELQVLGEDLSKEGTRKYEAMEIKVNEQFEKALPYFQQAEMADPNDRSTLQALKAMYARNNEYEISGEFKTRLEKIEAGETIEKSYFKEKGM